MFSSVLLVLVDKTVNQGEKIIDIKLRSVIVISFMNKTYLNILCLIVCFPRSFLVCSVQRMLCIQRML